MSSDIYKIIYPKGNATIVVTFLSLFLPSILYVNHLYNDILATFLCVAALFFSFSIFYGCKTYGSILVSAVFCSLAVITRANSVILFLALALSFVLSKRIKLAVLFTSVFVLVFLGYISISKLLLSVTGTNYPIWSWIQMGLTPETLGFQNGTHNISWTFSDVIGKVKNYTFNDYISIIFKKTFWIWSEGTYQSERYAFSYNGQWQYETFFVNCVADNSVFRDTLNSLIRGQYFAYIMLSILGIYQSDTKNNMLTILKIIVVGFLAFYIVWEIKSRYLYPIYPIICMFSASGLELFLKKHRLQHSI